MPFIMTTQDGHFGGAEVRPDSQGQPRVWLIFDDCRICLTAAEGRAIRRALSRACREADAMTEIARQQAERRPKPTR